MKQIKIIKNRSDIGAGTRGSDMGIDAIEIAAINSGNNYFNNFPYSDVESHNESIYKKEKALFAKRIEFVREQCQRVSDAVQNSLKEDNFTIVISGDHSSALGTLSGVKANYPKKRMGVVWIDAHADIHSPFTTPSGNIHGMPLAAALGKDNLDNQVNEVTDHTQSIWKQLKNIGVEGPKLAAEDLVYFGVRDTESTEEKLMNKHKIRNYKVEEIRYRGLQKCLDEVKAQLAHCEVIYISFDVDSLDCDLISKGTGTPVSKGFDPNEVKAIIKGLFDTKKVVSLEVTEINPLLDTKGNKMAETAFEVLDSVTSYYLELEK
ncbi:arginase [bacterium]|nr:arginase [bacterium]